MLDFMDLNQRFSKNNIINDNNGSGGFDSSIVQGFSALICMFVSTIK